MKDTKKKKITRVLKDQNQRQIQNRFRKVFLPKRKDIEMPESFLTL
jgi:hypothetical protein